MVRPIHSHADALPDGRLTAPAAERNAASIVAALTDWAPTAGLALEIAAGTGQHAVACARAFPGLDWQPTDVATARLASIDAWAAHAGLANIRPARFLDATEPGWSTGPANLVFFANLLHLITEARAAELIAGIARSLAPGGRWFVYGPFRTGNGFRSEGDARFHASLADTEPGTGYKDLEWVIDEAAARGMVHRATIEMPASNLSVVFER